MIGKIQIDQIKVDAIIGVYDDERIKKQLVLIDVEVDYNCQYACESDKLEHALDYYKITEEIYDFVSNSSFQLIETLAKHVVEIVLQYTSVTKTKVTVSKPDALSKAENVRFSLYKTKKRV